MREKLGAVMAGGGGKAAHATEGQRGERERLHATGVDIRALYKYVSGCVHGWTAGRDADGNYPGNVFLTGPQEPVILAL